MQHLSQRHGYVMRMRNFKAKIYGTHACVAISDIFIKALNIYLL
jgi:hypothetical protein